MTRRDIIGRGGAILAAIAGSLSLGGKVFASATQQTAQWDTPPEIIFKKSKDGTPGRTTIAWTATYGRRDRLVSKPGGGLMVDGTEPAQYGYWKHLSSDYPPMSELQDVLAGLDRLQRETLARISRA